MMRRCSLIFPEDSFAKLYAHLFPGDGDEHGAIIAAGVSVVGDEVRLLVRDVHTATDGVDFVDGVESYKTLKAEFIYPHFRRCRKEHLAYLAVHNHGGTDEVEFSRDDWNSHERNYPTMRALSEGLPVGALVFAKNAVAGDIWLGDGTRIRLSETRVLGSNIRRLYPKRRDPQALEVGSEAFVDRQLRFFGKAGQALLNQAKVAVVGAGGAGSLIIQSLAHLGVGSLTIIDPDRISLSNLSRVVGATRWDARYPFSGPGSPQFIRNAAEKLSARKTKIASRVTRLASPDAVITCIDDDVAKDSIARSLLQCDFLFLAADSMRARLVFNAIVQQYFIPGIQVGAKVRADAETGKIEDAYSVMRWTLPGNGCLWCSGFISPAELAIEAKTEEERKDQAYGVEEPNPSVITLNSVAASHAVAEFQMAYLGLLKGSEGTRWKRFKHQTGSTISEVHSPDPNCSECQPGENSRFGRGDGVELPTLMDGEK